ncbi:alpha/beta fold hydrolase [Streptomyces avermitilis]
MRREAKTVTIEDLPTQSRWLKTFRRVTRPRCRLVCAPHAGGTAQAYRTWPAGLPTDVEVHGVQYPGRQDRLGEAPPASMDDLVGPVADALEPFLGEPLALFGHSMGAASMSSGPANAKASQVLPDRAYMGAGPWMTTPLRRPPGRDLTPTRRTVNRALSAARVPVERGEARLKSWRISAGPVSPKSARYIPVQPKSNVADVRRCPHPGATALKELPTLYCGTR